MRKLYALIFIAFFLLCASNTNAQVSTYAFTQSSGAYTAITGGIVLGNTTSDDQRFVDPAFPLGGTVNTGPGFPIGFNFTYNGIVFDRFAINNNGWISLGQSSLTPGVDINSTSNLSTPLSSTATNTPAYLRCRIAGIGRDLQAQAGAELRIETIGSAPNRKCVIQWTGYRRFGATGDNINFQIVLNETSNVVNTIYGTNILAASTTCHVGLGGVASSDFNNRTTTTNWAATTAGATNTATCTISATVFPASGLTFIWTPPAVSVPTNDNCANAIAIACGGFAIGNTSLATLDGPGTSCSGGSVAPDVWYTIVGTGGNNIVASLCGSGYDTKIDVYTGTCGALVCVGGNDNFCGLQSQFSWPSVAATTYYIRVHGSSGATGSFILTVTCPPVNDLCVDALPIACGGTVTGTTVGATTDAVATCGTTLNTAPGVWYTFTGNGANVTLSLCGSAYDTKIGVFSGSCGSLVCVTGNDDFCGLQSQVAFSTVFGTQYFVLVTGFSSASGNFTLTRTCVFPNELCTGAVNINCDQVINGTTAGAAIDAVGTCVTPLNTAPGVWYSFTGDGSNVTLSLCGSGYDTKIGVFSGTCAALVCVTDNDDFCGLQSQVTFATTFGTQYYILITGFGTASGNYTLTRTCVPPCSGTPTSGTISGPATACVGGTGTLTLSGYSTNPGISIQWKSATVSGGPYTNIGGAINPTYNFTATGTTTYYIATVSCSNSGLSADSPQFTLIQGAPIHSAFNFTVTNACSPGTATITGTAINGAPGNYTHALTGPGTITPNASTGPNNSTGNFTVSNLPFGTHSFVLTTTDAIGCTIASTITGVTIIQTPIITFTPAAPVICNGDIQAITASVVPPTFQTFAQPATTIIQDPALFATMGIANPYPSLNTVSGLPTTGVSVKSVKLGNFNHTFPDDVDIVLVSPTGQAVILMSDAGGGGDVVGLDYTFDDAAAGTMPNSGPIPQGSYKPSNYGSGDDWPAPGPGTAPSSTTLSTFTGNPNGVWRLYVVDAVGGDVGFIGNWNITFSMPSLVTFSPITPNVFTNAAATIPYTGTAVGVVYVKPTTTTIYTATSTVAGCTGTATVTVTVNQLPAITVQPTPATQTICPGFNVTYSVTATGTGLAYQWKQGAANLVDNAQISGATTNTLTITNVNSSNTGTYTVVVTGVCPPAVTSNPVVLNVATAPVISTPPANRTVCVGQTANFTVATVGSIPPATMYQWQISTDAGVNWTNLTTGGSYTASFTTVATTIAMNNNRFRVLVTNDCGQVTISGSATLTVNAAPTVTAAILASRICISDTLIALSGTPVGGSWSGIGVSGFNFVPSATAVGSYTLTYTYTNALGCTASATVVARVEDCQERLRLLRDNAVILYPNPSNGRFNIRINSTLYNYLGMKVYNQMGQLVNGKTINEVLTSPVYTGLVYGRVIPIDLSHLPAGIYLVKFYYDDGVRTSEKAFQVVIVH